MGQWHYYLKGISKMIKVISESSEIEKLMTHVFPMRRIQEALEISASHNCAKIILKPWED